MTLFSVSNTLLSIFCRIFRRRHTEIFLKCSGEMTVIGKSHHICNLRNIDFTLSYQSGSLIETDVSQELAGRNTGHFLQLTMQLGAAYAHLITLKSESPMFSFTTFMIRSISSSSLPFTSIFSTLSSCFKAPLNLPFKRRTLSMRLSIVR